MILSVLSSPALVSGLMVVRAKNPVHSVLFLILVFRDTSGLLLLLGLDFFAMIFPVVCMNLVTIGFFIRTAGRLRVGQVIDQIFRRFCLCLIFLFLRPLIRLVVSFFYLYICAKGLGSWSVEAFSGTRLAFSSETPSLGWTYTESSSTEEAALYDVQAEVQAQAEAQAEAQAQAQAQAEVQAQMAALMEMPEMDLFARIRVLENKMVHGLPPQLNPGGYEQLVRENLAEALTTRYYATTLSNEIFEITILELKASLQEALFTQILAEPEIDRLLEMAPIENIRSQAYDFIEEKVEPVSSMRHRFQKNILEGTLRHFIRDLGQNRTNSFIYRDFLNYFLGH